MSSNEPTAQRNRAEIVMEIAMRRRFAERKKREVKRPTIDELEAMLGQENSPTIDILPDGSVATVEEQTVFISDLVHVAIVALYEDGFAIVRQESDAQKD